MGRVRNLLDILNLTEPEEIARFCSNAFREIQQIINGNISFEDNFRGKTVEVTFTVINQDTRIEHGLGYVPTGYIVTTKDVALNVYDGAADTTSSAIFLRSTLAGTANILIF